jgi:hypothetical protein
MKGFHSSSASAGHRSLSADYLKRSQRIFSTHEIDDDGLIEPQEDNTQRIHLSRGHRPHWSRSNSSHQKHRGAYEGTFESQEQRGLRMQQRTELSPNPRQMAAASRKTEQERPKPRIQINQNSVHETRDLSNQISSQQNFVNRRPISRPTAPNLNATSLRSQSNSKGEDSSVPMTNQSSPTSSRTLKLSLRQKRSSPTQPINSQELSHLHLPPDNNVGSLSDSIISPIDQTRSPLTSSSSSTSISHRQGAHLSDTGHSSTPPGRVSPSKEIQKKRVDEPVIGQRLTVEQLLHSQPYQGGSDDSNEGEGIDLPAVNLLVEKFYRSLQSRANGRFESFKRRLESVRSDR